MAHRFDPAAYSHNDDNINDEKQYKFSNISIPDIA